MCRWAVIAGLILLCAIAPAVPVQPIAANASADRFRALPFDNQRLAGILAMRLRANSEGFLEGGDAAKILENDVAPGLYLSAGAGAYEYRQDGKLRASLDQVAAGIAKRPLPDAYLNDAGTDPEAMRKALRTIRSNLLGLLLYYRVTGEESAYTAAQKIGDLLVKSTSLKTAVGSSAAAVALAEPLGVLYRYTAESAYLDLAKSMAEGAAELATSTEPETVQAFTALADLYRLTGNKRYLQAAVQGWQRLRQSPSASTAGGIPRPSKASASGLCFDGAWLRLTGMLMRITGEVQYGDALEQAIYNGILSAQNGRTGDVCQENLSGGRKAFHSLSETSALPCTLATAEAVAEIPAAVWGRFGNGIAVNLYSAGRATVQLRRRALVQMYSEASFPQRGDILLHIEPSRATHFPLRLRVPEWSKDFSVDFAGSHLVGKAGEYLVIDREWKRGDTVHIRMSMRVQLISDPNEPNRVTVQRGPQVLVVGHSFNRQIADLRAIKLATAETSSVTLTPLDNKFPSDWAGDQAYETKGSYAGNPVTLVLIPLADALDYIPTVVRESAGS